MVVKTFFGCVCFLIVSSCGTCDEDPINQHDISGTYRITSWNPPLALDLNDDGVFNRNLLLESDCFDGAHVRLNPDNTYFAVNRKVNVADGNLACVEETDSGTWQLTSSTVRLSSVEGRHHEMAYGTVNRILTLSLPNENYPVMNAGEANLNSGPVYVVFSSEWTY